VNPDPPLSDRSHENVVFVRSVVEQFQPQLLRYATRLLGDADRARDAVQDTFVRLLAQPRAAVDGHVAEWLFTVCRNRVFDINRKEGRMKRFAEGAAERVVAAEPRPGAELEAEEMHATVLRLIDRLPPNQQEVVRLKFQNGFSYKEISRITQLSVGNVGFLIHTAVQVLRREWPAEMPGVELTARREEMSP
jgi:RNA polymerase sigma-70 factor (ECF subfamily)